MLFAAATDHRYLDGGHTLDFVNKALEALDVAGWERAEAVLAALPAQLAFAERMEEANAWRNPVDLVALLEAAFERAAGGAGRAALRAGSGRHELVEVAARRRARPEILEALLAALRAGATEVELASAVSFAAATRIARFPTSNEFGDWDTALHTFTFANAVEQGLRRSPSPGARARRLRRGDERLPRPLPERARDAAARAARQGADPEALLAELPRPARPPAAGRRGGAARRVLPRRRRRPGPPRRRARRVPAARGPQLPHDPVRRGRASASTSSCAAPPTRRSRSSPRRATSPRTPRPRGRSARPTRSRSRLHRGERIYEDEEGLPPRPDRRMIAGCASSPAAPSPSSSPTSRARRGCCTSSATATPTR